MRESDIIFHNRSSDDFGMRVLFPFNPVVPSPNTQMETIPGVSGDRRDSNRTFGAVETPVNAVIYIPKKYNGDWWSLKSDIEHWLYGDENSKDWLVFELDPDFLYQAQIVTAPVFTPVNDERVNVTITFHFQPFKYDEKTIHWSKLPASGIAINPENTNVRPDWHLNGNGSFLLTVNGFPYEFDDLDGDIWLIGDEGNAYSKDPSQISDDNSLLNDHLRLANNEAPELICSGDGQNSISIAPIDSDSKLNSIEFKPKYRRLI